MPAPMIVEFRIPPEHKDDLSVIRKYALRSAGIHDDEAITFTVLRRSLDARGKKPRFVLRVALGQSAETSNTRKDTPGYTFRVHERPAVHIIGAGPAGYFAALELIRHNLRPVILERGKDVRSRRRDLRNVQQFGIVDPDSNYCFGEGGAGTYSDGKLYTRSRKRGDVTAVLRTLVDHGANPDILIDAHPHIGSNKLPGIVAAIRETITAQGGEVHFGQRVTDITVNAGKISELEVNGDRQIPVQHVILATGHSARDIYDMLVRHGIGVLFKPFAIGVRIEHPQPLIDKLQYGIEDRGSYLPAAAYQLSCQAGTYGVFSFCMCPGGLIVPAATAPGEIVLNGMSLSRRDSPFANAGTVVTVDWKDIGAYRNDGPLGGMHFQSSIERGCFDAGDGSQQAPAQRLTDFLNGKPSTDLPETSYIPGIYPYRLNALLPEFITGALRQGIRNFGRMMHGYLTREAVAVATESRTSAPVRIPRDVKTLMHPQVAGLFPCGEGAGYAGGIVSAALDGQHVARIVTVVASGSPSLKNTP